MTVLAARTTLHEHKADDQMRSTIWGPALVVAITSRSCFPQEELGNITWPFRLFWLREYFEVLRDTQERLTASWGRDSRPCQWQFYNISEGPTWCVRASSCLWFEGQRCHVAIVFAEWVVFCAFDCWQSHGTLKACSLRCSTHDSPKLSSWPDLALSSTCSRFLLMLNAGSSPCLFGPSLKFEGSPNWILIRIPWALVKPMRL